MIKAFSNHESVQTAVNELCKQWHFAHRGETISRNNAGQLQALGQANGLDTRELTQILSLLKLFEALSQVGSSGYEVLLNALQMMQEGSQPGQFVLRNPTNKNELMASELLKMFLDSVHDANGDTIQLAATLTKEE